MRPTDHALMMLLLVAACERQDPYQDSPGPTMALDTDAPSDDSAPVETGPPTSAADTALTDTGQTDTAPIHTGDTGDTGAACPTSTGGLLLSGTIDLDTPAYHAKIEATIPDFQIGYYVQDAGDVNDDGFSDLLVHATGSVGTDNGEALLIHGPLSGVHDISTAAVRILDETPGVGYGYFFGEAMARGADYDGLGVDDVVIGNRKWSPPWTTAMGAVYLFAGPFGTPGTVVSAATYDARITGTTDGREFGLEVDLAGDVNGDGQADLVVGSTWSFTGPDPYLLGPDIFVFYGPIAHGDHVDIDADVVIYNDAVGSQFGFYIESLGDVDGDGLDDLATVDPSVHTGAEDAGAGYVFLGPMVDGTTASGADAIRWEEHEYDRLGNVAGPGDVNGDGYDDLALGAPQTDYNGTDAGSSWLIYGPITGQEAISSADVRLDGFDAYDYTTKVARAGDLDLDGVPDLLVGAPTASGSRNEGGIYVIYSTVADGVHVIDDVMGAVILGELGGDEAYNAVGVDDFDGDCQPDILIGARYNGVAGAAYVVRGGYGP